MSSSNVTPFPTTDGTIRRDLLHSLNARGVEAGSTFGDFIEAVRAFGVTDATPLSSIEWGVLLSGSGHVVCDEAPDGIEVREMTAADWRRGRGLK